jgi:hypothetical protein
VLGVGEISIQVLAPLSMRLRLAEGPQTARLTQEIRPGDSVINALRRLAERYPALVGTVLDGRCESIEPGVVVAVDGVRVSGQRSLTRELEDGATILITTAVAGG